ncbi:MAG: hypothetical protein AAGM38_03835 [Pseudomonadota bacterium]
MQSMKAVLFGVLLLSGCGAIYEGRPVAESALYRDAELSAALAEANGVVALSIASDPIDTMSFFQRVKADPHVAITLQVENIETQERYQFREPQEILAEVPIPLLASDDLGEGDVYAHSLPAGAYRITNVHVFWFGGGADGPEHREWVSGSEFSIPFRVGPGQTHYLGEWRCLPQTDPDVVGPALMDGCLFAVSDRFERDVLRLKERFTGVNWTAMRNDTLREGDAPQGLIAFR